MALLRKGPLDGDGEPNCVAVAAVVAGPPRDDNALFHVRQPAKRREDRLHGKGKADGMMDD